MIIATLATTFVSGGQLFYRLGNEQVWLPTKTANCSAMLTSLISSGKWQPSAEQLLKISMGYATAMPMTTPTALEDSVANSYYYSTNSTTNFLESSLAANQTKYYQSTWLNTFHLLFIIFFFISLEPWLTLPAPLLYMFSISYFLFPFLSLLVGCVVALAISTFTGLKFFDSW